MDQISHLTMAAAFVGSLTALIVLAVRAASDGLDRLSTRRRVARRLRDFAR